MIVLDAYALIAFLVGGPARSQVRAILREHRTAIPTANLIESLDVSQRIHGLPIDRSLELIDPLFEGSLEELVLDRARARRAAEIRAKHYHRSRCPISLGDAVLLASCGADDQIATSDRHVLSIAEGEGLGRLPLPSQG